VHEGGHDGGHDRIRVTEEIHRVLNDERSKLRAHLVALATACNPLLTFEKSGQYRDRAAHGSEATLGQERDR
jgi:hypothetical protein